MRIGNEDLEDVEAFILNHLSFIPQQIHTYLQMLSSINVCRHHRIIGSIEENFTEQFYGLAFGDITLGLDKHVVIFVKKEIEVRRKVLCYNLLMFGQQLL